MKTRFTEHILSLVLVSLLLIAALLFIRSTRNTDNLKKSTGIRDYLSIQNIDLSDPFQKALFRETLNIYYPGQEEKNDSLVKALLAYKDNLLKANADAYTAETLTFDRLLGILGMYAKFLLLYAVVMALTYYGVQTLGVLRFVRRKRKHEAPPKPSWVKGALGIFAYFVLFSPSYVLAYSLRTEFNTDTALFMILLAVVSNGLLVMYADKFYNYLMAESRKGYVETAKVKNLNNSYGAHDPKGIPWKAVLRVRKNFDGHVFGHIYRNARYQYLTTLREQASFLITGLVIIEMALNIHGHFSYEMLRQMLYKNDDIVMVFFLGIFVTVKVTEMAADWVYFQETRRYENH